jgi:hypothetical protein
VDATCELAFSIADGGGRWRQLWAGVILKTAVESGRLAEAVGPQDE